jgi:mevalonate pyrophosphate decarboxylase
MVRDYLSICSASGWWAAFHFHNQFHFSKLVVFATRRDTRDDERHEIVAIDIARYNERLNRCVEDDPYFVEIFPEEDFAVPGVLTADAAARMNARLQERRG